MPHLIGGILGGAAAGLIGAALAALVALLVPVDVAIAGAATALLVLSAGEIVGRRVWWSADRQVPRDFQRTKYHRTTALLWGVDLGFGWSTKQPSAALMMTTAAALVAGADAALAAGTVFGTSRAATLLFALGARDRADVERRFIWFAKHRAVCRAGTAMLGSTLIVSMVIAA